MPDFSSYFVSSHKRTKVLGLLVGAIFVVFVLRLFYIQVIRHDYYVTEARNSQVTKLTIFPERGKIYARDSDTVVPLVLNEAVYTVFADPYEVKDAAAIRKVLQRVAGGEMLADSFNLLSDTSRRYVVLARQVSRTQAELIKKEDLAGVGLQQGTRRVYPENGLAGQLLGYVNTENIGQYGLEEYMNTRLVGQAGLLQSVSDVRRIPLTIGTDSVQKPVVNGDDIVLSIDRNIQQRAETALKEQVDKVQAKSGSVVVMNPNNGQVMAMANYPTYEPAKYSSTTDYSLFQNQVVDNPYEAGSVIKTLTVAAGIEDGAITPTSTSPNPNGCTTVEDRTICNVLRNVTSQPTTQDLLTLSLNTGAVNVFRQLGGGSFNSTGREKLYDFYVGKYRFTKQTGIEQANEAKGVVFAPTDEEGNNVRYANMTFGQGMTTTMMQVTTAFSSIVNGGTYYKPTLLYGVRKTDGTVTTYSPTTVAQGIITAEHSAQMRDLIWHARYDRTGKTIDPAGYKVGGKTGTSEVIDPKTGQYTSDHTVGSYLGFGGATQPEYVIMVRIDDAQGGVFAGSGAASAAFTSISNWALKYLNISPN